MSEEGRLNHETQISFVIYNREPEKQVMHRLEEFGGGGLRMSYPLWFNGVEDLNREKEFGAMGNPLRTTMPGVRCRPVKGLSELMGQGVGQRPNRREAIIPISPRSGLIKIPPQASCSCGASFRQSLQSLSVCCARVGSSSGQSQQPDARKE